MQKKQFLVLAAICLFSICSLAQTTTGVMTGLVTDSSGAAVAGAQVNVTNQGTGVLRTTTSGANGIYLVPQLSPGIYDVSVKKQGFTDENRKSVQLDVNQSVTLDFKLGVASVAQSVTVTGAEPLLNTTSASLSAVVGHELVVDLPLNGRQFVQLAMLTPGASPVQNNTQQGTYTVSLGSGAISPAVNGQQGYQNNFTMDGVENNAIYTDIWAISPPPDALEEFNVQAHITDAQFAISSGANINLVTRSGTNAFHGALWEFLRNADLNAQQYPATAQLPYEQNQYGLYFGGPVTIPHVFNGKNNTWFSLYWEGFRSKTTSALLESTLTSKMIAGDYSAELGTTSIGTDCNGQTEYANEIYDPTTSVADPCHKGEFLRTPFSYNGKLNVIPPNRLNAVSQALVAKYYPAPNLNAAEGVTPNYEFNGATTIASDVFGVRLDHQITPNDTIFVRFNRDNANRLSPEDFPTYDAVLSNYRQQAALGYTHIFNPKTIVNFRYGYTYTHDLSYSQAAGEGFDNAINFTAALPPRQGIYLGPNTTISNSFGGVTQSAFPFGPLESMDYHLDLTKIVGIHTFGAGVVYMHYRSYDDGWQGGGGFTQNATAQDGLAGPTGYGPASFMLGAMDSYLANIGSSGADQTENWWGYYAQDEIQLNPRLVLTAGIRWDYVSPPNYHRVVSGLNFLTGVFAVSGPVPPAFPTATGPSGFFYPQYNGYEPRLGLTYRFSDRGVVHGAFAILDDHNNTLIQENQNVRLAWPAALQVNTTSLDLGLPQMYISNIPSAASYLSSVTPFASYGADNNNKIPYSMQYNLGLQYQVSNTIVAKLDYVGSASRHQYFVPLVNTALTPGPGAVLPREPYPQYGGPFSFSWNEMPTAYNGLQAQATKRLSNGLTFQASYTWSKTMDWLSNPYTGVENIYNMPQAWGPSTFSLKHVIVLSGVYSLPIGRGQRFLSSANSFVQTIAGGWNLSAILSLHTGLPFNGSTGSDIANIGSSNQRPNEVGPVYSAPKTTNAWLNKAGFAQPSPYTFGNEKRDDLIGPAYRDLDASLSKDFPLFETAKLQLRGDAFNVANTTNYGNPNATLNSTSFGKITSANPARLFQVALKVVF